MDEEERDRWLYRIIAITSSEVSEDLKLCLEEAERRISLFRKRSEATELKIDEQIFVYMSENNLTYCVFETEGGIRGQREYIAKISVSLEVNKK